MTSLELPATIDLPATATLAEALRATVGPVSLDGAAVERIGTAGLQLLLCAQRTAKASGEDWTIGNPSAALRLTLEAVGAGRLLATAR